MKPAKESQVLSIRQAIPEDYQELFALDPLVKTNTQRPSFIERIVNAGNCWVAVIGKKVAGYCALEYTFYDLGFISILYVHPEHRRKAIGSTLVRHLEALCITPKIFTSTNLSNLAMQALLNKLGYSLTGVIHNLDEGDPEIVFMKYLQRT
ncbi:MAG: GNAT family N-acetyltransferase [Dehalococcoidia bacterium]|nr:GNAT family N-acetyltransferase [Dehalococcoidia bacterium]